ncbi:nucleoside deaminase [Halorarius halobius]|uniref:nucleoside deaminase n=1 Tax=Halorarius halobius TaxID=2962671 RepID=UPI0020CE2641|nr:nucleoside deaminase [Halorarius halobius]
MDFDALDHERYMERALELAREAADRGDEPFGSLLVRDGEVVMEARNAVSTADDLRRHPELTLAQRAASEFTPAECAETVMYTSTEPCPMCSGGIHIAGLGAVVYSVSAERAGELTGGDLAVPSTEILDRGRRDVEVVGPVLPEAGADVHRDYW